MYGVAVEKHELAAASKEVKYPFVASDGPRASVVSRANRGSQSLDNRRVQELGHLIGSIRISGTRIAPKRLRCHEEGFQLQTNE